jgi:3-oxoacyl-[acyl-carrier-protein] synthase I
MRRVVVTGMGIVSCIGTDKQTVLDSLMQGRSGIIYRPEYAERGMRSLVAGAVELDFSQYIDRKDLRFMGAAAAYGHIAMQQAIKDAGLTEQEVSNERTGIIMGAGGSSSEDQVETADILREKGLKRIGPYRVPRTMGSTVSACLATAFRIRGINYSISSACATSAHCIGNAMELIQLGKQDMIFAGGGEAEHWTLSCMFDAMGALSTKYNATPDKASRAYDVNRDGFVIAGGGGVLVIEALDHALARGATIYAELTGYGANSDGADMVAPSGEGAVRCMKIAMATTKRPIDYINSHGTSTPVGDVKEIEAIRNTFGEKIPPVSSTKSLTGHSLGATGVQEAIYSILMMQNSFIAASANIENLDPAVADIPIVQTRIDNRKLDAVMSNSFGFGGTNATLVFERYEG